MVRVLDDNVTATLFSGRQVNLLQYHLGRSASVCQPAAPRRNWVRSRSGCRVSAAWPAWPRHEPTIIKRCQNIAPLRCQNISEIKNTSVRRDGWHTPRISQMMPLSSQVRCCTVGIGPVVTAAAERRGIICPPSPHTHFGSLEVICYGAQMLNLKGCQWCKSR